MSETSESLRRKIDNAGELDSVVRTMKAIAASNITQYEIAVKSLSDYYRTVSLGIFASLSQEKIDLPPLENEVSEKIKTIAIVFGSDMGLVGSFNHRLTDFVTEKLGAITGEKEVWPVGERMQRQLSESGFTTTVSFIAPGSVSAITSLVGQILIEIERVRRKNEVTEFYLFHNRSVPAAGYTQVHHLLFPLDKKWEEQIKELKWPTKKPPQVLGEATITLAALIREYLFVALFRACAESLASENASRLQAMQRAEKNIEDLLEYLSQDFNRLRQDTIDEELFDVISGFEALQKPKGSAL